MIKTITIEAVSIKTNKKDGSPYMWNDKKTNTMKPRTMVSVKYKDGSTGPEGEWLMGWSYKAGSAAEALAAGQTVEIKYEESAKANPDGSTSIFKSWRFPKQEDKDADEIAKLKAQLAQVTGKPSAPVTAQVTPVAINTVATAQVYPPQASVPTNIGATAVMPTPSGTSGNAFHSPTPSVASDGSAPLSEIPF